MWGRVREIIKKEFYQTLRDPRMRVLLVLPPIIQLIVFGYAVNLDIETSSMAWVDQDLTPRSRELLAEFQGSHRFLLKAVPAREKEIQYLLDRGEVQIVVRVLPGFARDIERGNPVSVQVLLDGTNSNTASILASYAQQVVSGYGRKVLAGHEGLRLAALTESTGAPVAADLPVLTAQSRVWFNPSLKSRYYFVPGVVVNIIALVTIMLTAMSIVREKEIGTMEQLMVSPIRPIELMLGKLLPFAVIGLVDVAVVTTAALAVFRVPFRGNALLLLGSAVLFLLTTLGAGLFISTVSQTQQQAVMSSFFFFMPAFMLSGFTFPIRNMPVPVQYLTYADPLRYFIEIVRGVFLKGTGSDILWPQMAALALFGVTVLGLSAARFRKRLD
ncbi:MAG: ABC transporter permease [Acidobacteria bacterium]|nr:MAG: ABC transporter permease [Acidobacteriota bacterium]PYV35417.1 MAG: ABC transporter permease [Acidobacteriota bacterium]